MTNLLANARTRNILRYQVRAMARTIARHTWTNTEPYGDVETACERVAAACGYSGMYFTAFKDEQIVLFNRDRR